MLRAALLLALACLALAFAFAGLNGVVGMALGLSTGAFGAFTLYQTVRMLRGTGERSSTGVLFTLVAFFAKFPVIGLGAYLAIQLGMRPLVAFVSGLLVVYSTLVWRASRSDLYPH